MIKRSESPLEYRWNPFRFHWQYWKDDEECWVHSNNSFAFYVDHKLNYWPEIFYELSWAEPEEDV